MYSLSQLFPAEVMIVFARFDSLIKEKAAYAVVGSLAYDVRQYWGEMVGERLNKIKELRKRYNLKGCKLTQENIGEIYDDGRWFRSCEWKGPYGVCNLSDVLVLDMDVELWTCPKTSISDYYGESDSCEESDPY